MNRNKCVKWITCSILDRPCRRRNPPGTLSVFWLLSSDGNTQTVWVLTLHLSKSNKLDLMWRYKVSSSWEYHFTPPLILPLHIFDVVTSLLLLSDLPVFETLQTERYLANTGTRQSWCQEHTSIVYVLLGKQPLCPSTSSPVSAARTRPPRLRHGLVSCPLWSSLCRRQRQQVTFMKDKTLASMLLKDKRLFLFPELGLITIK